MKVLNQIPRSERLMVILSGNIETALGHGLARWKSQSKKLFGHLVWPALKKTSRIKKQTYYGRLKSKAKQSDLLSNLLHLKTYNEGIQTFFRKNGHYLPTVFGTYGIVGRRRAIRK